MFLICAKVLSLLEITNLIYEFYSEIEYICKINLITFSYEKNNINLISRFILLLL